MIQRSIQRLSSVYSHVGKNSACYEFSRKELHWPKLDLSVASKLINCSVSEKEVL